MLQRASALSRGYPLYGALVQTSVVCLSVRCKYSGLILLLLLPTYKTYESLYTISHYKTGCTVLADGLNLKVVWHPRIDYMQIIEREYN